VKCTHAHSDQCWICLESLYKKNCVINPDKMPSYPAMVFTSESTKPFNTDCYHLGHRKCLLSHLKSVRSTESDLACKFDLSNLKEMCSFEEEFLRVASPLHKIMRSDLLETAALCRICRRPYNTACEDDERTHSYMSKEMELKEIPAIDISTVKRLPSKFIANRLI